MSSDEPPSHSPTVFLSYASEDRQAARTIGAALPGYGLEVWYDESELGGGDAWDQKIRRQIRDCDYFMALISAQTEARHEGYFRREWRLAVERTLDMADDHTFLLPIVIDDTQQDGARVPEKFLAVQWLKIPRGEPTAALEALCRRLVSGEPGAPAKKGSSRKARLARPSAPAYPQFPRQEPGQTASYWLRVIGWALQSAWVFFKRMPRWVQIVAYVWIATLLLSKGCSSSDHKSSDLSPADAQKLKAISEQYRGAKPADVAKLGAQIAREFADAADKSAERSPLLALPFTAPDGDALAGKLADSSFAQVFGRISISHPGQVGLSKDSAPARDLNSALERGRANHSQYILWGTAAPAAGTAALTVKLLKVADESVLWSKVYPADAADPVKIAAEIDANVPSLDSD